MSPRTTRSSSTPKAHPESPSAYQSTTRRLAQEALCHLPLPPSSVHVPALSLQDST